MEKRKPAHPLPYEKRGGRGVSEVEKRNGFNKRKWEGAARQQKFGEQGVRLPCTFNPMAKE